jgi:aminoglycoside/choline kinase family phosphotransferase
MTHDVRLAGLKNWITHTLQWQDATIEVASADASFRRYFRVTHAGKTTIAMDAPPEKEDTEPFIDITQRLLKTGVHAPDIIAENKEQGFLLLEDLGSCAYLDILNKTTANKLYNDALQALITLQKADRAGLPLYAKTLLHDEMALMPEWFLGTHLNIKLNRQQQTIIEQTFEQLCTAISTQSTGFVHRDYHSRNLLQTTTNNPGIIDYQDAVTGPLTYDVVSLLRDCYIAWPIKQVEAWALSYRDKAVAAQLMPAIDDNTFIRDFDLMGLQRHIKVLGIFARLYHRDGKENYLNDLPMTLSYVMSVGKKHTETKKLIQLFEELGVPNIISETAV